MGEVINHCASCGKEIEPEEEFCEECVEKVKDLEPCPDCGRVICQCEIGSGE